MPDIIVRLKEANIIGRGGAEFPAHQKWAAVRDATAKAKYVICNASEREPAVFKDFHILSHEPEKVFAGLTLAMTTVGATEGIFNLNAEYAQKLKETFSTLIAKAKGEGCAIRIFEEFPSYIGGEETALLNAIEGRRCEPRLRPPFPTEQGLYGCPTLIHNVETLYDIACVSDGTFEGKRFYSISGAVEHTGVFHLPSSLTALQVLTETGNLPEGDFFAQLGGGGSGAVFNRTQLETERVRGAGAIIVHRCDEDARGLVLSWLEFFQRESCGKCTPCREGTYQLVRLMEDSDAIPWERMTPIFDVLEKTSFCALGRSVPLPVQSYYRNVFQRQS